MSRRRIFAYGTLEVPELMEALVGHRPPASAAVLEGYARFLVRGRPYPGIVAAPGARTEGVLYEGIDEDSLELLDHFEGSLYERREVRVRTDRAEKLAAETYIVPKSRSGALGPEPWDRERFVARHLPAYAARCVRLRRSLRRRFR